MPDGPVRGGDVRLVPLAWRTGAVLVAADADLALIAEVIDLSLEVAVRGSLGSY